MCTYLWSSGNFYFAHAKEQGDHDNTLQAVNSISNKIYEFFEVALQKKYARPAFEVQAELCVTKFVAYYPWIGEKNIDFPCSNAICTIVGFSL